MVVNVIVQQGNPLKVLSDAVITFVSPTGPWLSAVDQAIRSKHGPDLHDQLTEQMPLQDSDAVLTRATSPPAALADAVLFIVDDETRPLGQLVLEGLRAADRKELKWVTLGFPATRLRASLYHPLGPHFMNDVHAAIQTFIDQEPEHIYCIKLFEIEG